MNVFNSLAINVPGFYMIGTMVVMGYIRVINHFDQIHMQSKARKVAIPTSIMHSKEALLSRRFFSYFFR